uniref:EF-hand domain-containing protein n=1 Tax=Globisporangium ultimum (strain ATCC 200006 / CBS 805.95 / DAOM BR144) TaxID=431595 RepID=K3WZH3_GLOUD
MPRGGAKQGSAFQWQHESVHLAIAPWTRESKHQGFVQARVAVSEEMVPQYALVFSVVVRNVSTRDGQVHVTRRVTKAHLTSALERAVSGENEPNRDFVKLQTRAPASKSKQQRDGHAIDDAVRQWLVHGKAAPSRDEIVLWLLSRMILVRQHDDESEPQLLTLAICGERGAEHAMVTPSFSSVHEQVKHLAPQVTSRERMTSHSATAEQVSSNRVEEDECDRDEDDDQLPDYDDTNRTMTSSFTESDDDGHEVRSVHGRDEIDSMMENATAAAGDEDAAPESQDVDESSADSTPKTLTAPDGHTKRDAIKKFASSASITGASATLGPSRASSASLQPKIAGVVASGHIKVPSADEQLTREHSQFIFEPTSVRRHSVSNTRTSTGINSGQSSRSLAMNPNLEPNKWTQDRRSFQLELHKSKRDILAATQLQTKTETIAALRRQQLTNQSQRKLRVHDQTRSDARRVTQLIADTLEYHGILDTLTQQVKRTKIAAQRDQERVAQTMRVALGRTEKHKKGPVLGPGPLSQRQIDALLGHRRNGDEDVDNFVYDLHGRRHAADEAGEVAAFGVFESTMRKIKRAFLDLPNDKGGTEDLLQGFRKFDDNRSGTLDHGEFRRALEGQGVMLTEEQVRVLFAQFDPNQNGEIDYGELLWGFFNRRAFRKKWQLKKTRLSDREIKLLFYQYDRTGRGALSVRDFQLAMHSIGFKLSDQEVKLLALKFDTNHDGFIDYHEFYAFVSQQDNKDVEDAADERAAQDEKHETSKARRHSSSSRKSCSSSTKVAVPMSEQRESTHAEDEVDVESILEELRALSETQRKIREAIRK